MGNQKAESDSSPEKPVSLSRESSGQNASPQKDATKDADRKPSKLKRLWRKTELDVPTLMMMFKYGTLTDQSDYLY